MTAHAFNRLLQEQVGVVDQYQRRALGPLFEVEREIELALQELVGKRGDRNPGSANC